LKIPLTQVLQSRFTPAEIAKRPLLKDGSELEAILKSRLKMYKQADVGFVEQQGLQLLPLERECHYWRVAQSHEFARHYYWRKILVRTQQKNKKNW
jgi:shikimate kinase